jgi:hypothetical protein
MKAKNGTGTGGRTAFYEGYRLKINEKYVEQSGQSLKEWKTVKNKLDKMKTKYATTRR